MEKIFEQIDNLFVNGVINGIISIVIAGIVLIAINKLLNKFIKKKWPDNYVLQKRIKKIILITIFLAIVCSEVKFLKSFATALLASGGIVAVVIGLASQEAAGNLINGAMIMAYKPYKIGDFIVVTGHNVRGTVIDISLRHSVIETLEKTQMIVPNDIMNKAIIEILGLNRNQFLQIAMIAQGDFQKLLLADTKERQGIFREIFKTGGYQILQEKLKAESGKLSDELEFARRSVNQYLEGVLGKEEINFAKLPMEEAIAAIKELIGLDQEEAENINCKLQNLQKELEQIQEHLQKAQTREQTIRTLELAEADYIKVQEQGEKIQQEWEGQKKKQENREELEVKIAQIQTQISIYQELEEKKKRINKYELFVKLYNSGIKETKHLMAELQISKNTVYVYTRRAQKEKKIFKIDRNTEKNITKQLITRYPFEVALNLNLQPEIIYKYLENLGEKDQKTLQREILSQNAIWKKIKSLKVKYLKNNQEISVEESLKKIIPKLKETEVFELIKFYYWCGKESMALQVTNQIIYFAENSKEIKQQAQLEKDKLLREIMVKKIISRKGTTYSSLCKELNVRESFLIQILGREDEDR